MEMAVRRQMKNKLKKFLIIVIIIFFLVIAFILFKEKTEENPNKVYCKPEQRNADVCIEIYEPVCGFSDDNLQTKTFSNSCFVCIDKNVEYYVRGECR